MKALSSEPKEPDSGIATNVSWWSSIDKSGVECVRWRKALREQVEKELDYQVRVRLAGSGRIVVRPLSHAQQVKREILQVSGRFSDQKQSHRILSATPTGITLDSAPTSRLVESPIIDHKETLSLRRVNMSPTVYLNECREDWRSKLPVLFTYISSKYGTPVEQLVHLSSTGCFKSDSIKSSGYGDGSVVRFPPEANITFPTPTHLVNTSLAALFPLKPEGTESSLVPEICQGQYSSLEASYDQLNVEACKFASECIPNSKLHFESRFEGGNLQQVIEIGPQEYQLMLRPDLYSKRHMQWFYFRVCGMQAGIPYHFHIVNLQKPDSLYNHGMQPLLYSEKQAECGWTRVGYNVTYSRNYGPLVMSCSKDLFTLSWTMEFPHSDDCCYLAHCFPYPYSKLLQYIEHLQLSPTIAPYLHCQELCKTLAGNTCPLLTITDFKDVSNMSSRAGVLLSARVHPGETNSSWMMEGLIDWLTSDAPHAKVLRSHFVFKLIPMLNPDGVIVGNSRTSLAGVDLNRTYKKPRRDLFPTVFHTKALLGSFMQEREVVLYMDLHGHSRKHNVFTYGCGSKKGNHDQFLHERVFPFLLSRQLPDMFCLRSCKYSVERCKESTGRVVAWRMGLANAFTLESTFCGSTLGQIPSWQFCERDLEGIGRGLGEAIYRYHRILTSKRYKQKILSELAGLLLKRCDSPLTAVELPDLVQSTVHQQKNTTGRKRDKNEPRPKPRDSANKVLKEFMKCDLSLLEIESSTTGSDSENDEIDYPETKKKKQQRRRKRHLHMHRSSTLPSLQPLHNQHTSTLRLSSTHPDREPSDQFVATIHQQRTWSRNNSSEESSASKRAPQEQQTSGKQQTWKFVNRYAHRSNGGIPMFSEERLQERTRKLQHQTSPTDKSRRTQLLWQPEGSNVKVMAAEEFKKKESEKGSMDSSRVSGASTQGYMTISRLEKPQEAVYSKVSTCRSDVGGGRRVPPLGERERLSRDLLGDIQYLERIKRSNLRHGYTNVNTIKLPTHLAKYISEIWKSSIQ